MGNEDRPSSRFCVGLDFGTARSGFSYCTWGGNVNVTLKWEGNPGQAYCKTLTALLYRRGEQDAQELEAWGWEAYSKFTSLPREQAKDHTLVEKFKLLLAPTSVEKRQVRAHIQQSLEDFEPEQLVADFLRNLKEYAVNHLTASYGGLDQEKVTWVLTVPAGWSDAAVHTMRQAAVQAAIIPHASDTRLVIAIEPEAAALSILNDSRYGLSLNALDSLVLVDAGGGTVDITAHNIKRAMGKWVLEECYVRQCLLKGSTFLDEAFEDWLAMQFGWDAFESWKDEYPVHYSKFFHTEWESGKINFRGDNKAVLSLPKSLARIIPVEELARVNDDEIAAEDGELIISDSQMKRFFDSLVDDILKRVGVVLENIGGRCDHMVLVGGFGESPYLFRRLKQEFGKKVNAQVASPDSPSQAVLKGAALYGQRQSAIAVRHTRFAYGIGTTREWAPDGKESSKRLAIVAGRLLETHVFNKMVGLNRKVKHDEVRTTFGNLVHRFQEVASFPVFASTSNNATHTDEPSMIKLGKVELKLPPDACTEDPENYVFKTDLTFGATELGVTATDLQTGKRVSADLQYVDQVF